MNEPDEESPQPASAASPSFSFRTSTWSTPALIGGLAVLFSWRLTYLIDPRLLSGIPSWLLLLISGVVPQALVLVYPLVTRQRDPHCTTRFPHALRFLKEALIAIPVVIGCVIILGVIESVLESVAPGNSMTPDFMKQMSQWPNYQILSILAFLACLLAPVAEEIFFRGFLMNALGKRMPMILAVIVQAIVFGFAHTYSTQHSLAALFLGLVLGMLYWWRQTIIAPMIAHALINSLAMLGLLISMQQQADKPCIGVWAEQGATECVIGGVLPGGPADAAGLLQGDIIKHIDEKPVQEFTDLITAVNSYQPGDTITANIEREGQTMELTVVLISRQQMASLEPPAAVDP